MANHINKYETKIVNLGIELEQKNVLVGKSYVGEEREQIFIAFKEFINVITWKYK